MGVARKQVPLRLPLTLLARLDRLRGRVDRNKYLTDVIEHHVNAEELRRHHASGTVTMPEIAREEGR